MKRLALIGVMAMVLCLMAAPAFAGWNIDASSLNATMETPGVVIYDGSITTDESDVATYVRVYEYGNTTDVLGEAFPGTTIFDTALPFSGTFRFDGLIPARLVVDLYGYNPVIVGQNRNKSIYHYANWILTSMAPDANAGWSSPTVPGTYSAMATAIFIDSPIVDAGVTELDFSGGDTSLPITVTNDGEADLLITEVSTPSSAYTIVENCTIGAVIPASTCTITVTSVANSASIKSNNTLYASLGSGILLLGIGLAFAPKGSKSTIVIMLLAVTLTMGVLQACGSDSSNKNYIRITSDDPNGVTEIKLIK